jgi:hypothetical protein
MILFCVSLPGRVGEWCDTVIGRLAETVLGPVVSTGANTLEELGSALIRTEGQHFYVGARQPGRWWRENLGATNKPFVVAVDDPCSAAQDLVIRHRLEPAEATRRVASSCALIGRYAALPGAFVVGSAADWSNPAATVAALARHLGLPVGATDIERIAAEAEAAYPRPSDESGEVSPLQLPAHSLAVMNGALAPYVGYLMRGDLMKITWARDLFFEDHHQPAIRPIDISGKIRHLIYGPYIALPPGNWVAEIVLGFTEDAVNMSFSVDIWAGSRLSVASMNPSGPGLTTVNLSFVIEESNDNLIEIRVMNERSAIYGQLALGQATLSLRQNVSPKVIETLTTELGLSPHAPPAIPEAAGGPSAVPDQASINDGPEQ